MSTESHTPDESTEKPFDYARRAMDFIDGTKSMSFEMLLRASELQLLIEIRNELHELRASLNQCDHGNSGFCTSCMRVIYSTPPGL